MASWNRTGFIFVSSQHQGSGTTAKDELFRLADIPKSSRYRGLSAALWKSLGGVGRGLDKIDGYLRRGRMDASRQLESPWY